jgi:clan AA aspartic protease (TIGR02281 family)
MSTTIKWTYFSVIVMGGLLTGQVLLASGLYRCTDEDGHTVYTDRPAQMPQCEGLASSRGTSSPSDPMPSVPAAPPSMPVIPASAVPPLPGEAPVAVMDPTITIPVRRLGHLYVVPVQLNGGRTAHLILDTGASHTILSHEVIRDLTLLPSDYQSGLARLNTASGAVDAQLVRIESMKMSSAEVRNSTAAVHTVPDFPTGVDGLLGLSFLREFEVTLDTAKSELRLRRSQK